MYKNGRCHIEWDHALSAFFPFASPSASLSSPFHPHPQPVRRRGHGPRCERRDGRSGTARGNAAVGRGKEAERRPPYAFLLLFRLCLCVLLRCGWASFVPCHTAAFCLFRIARLFVSPRSVASRAQSQRPSSPMALSAVLYALSGACPWPCPAATPRAAAFCPAWTGLDRAGLAAGGRSPCCGRRGAERRSGGEARRSRSLPCSHVHAWLFFSSF